MAARIAALVGHQHPCVDQQRQLTIASSGIGWPEQITRPTTASSQERAGVEGDPYPGDATVTEAAALYLAGADPRQPYASPLYADLRGLPPLLIHVGDAEVILDDSTRPAARGSEAWR